MRQSNGILFFSVNVAFNQPTYQYRGGGQQASSRAVDDNLSTHRDDCTKSHQGAYPWLAVDMGTHRNLAEVDVLNRAQGRVSYFPCNWLMWFQRWPTGLLSANFYLMVGQLQPIIFRITRLSQPLLVCMKIVDNARPIGLGIWFPISHATSCIVKANPSRIVVNPSETHLEPKSRESSWDHD